MPYFEHGSLKHRLQSSFPDAAQKRSVLRQIVLALACMHSQDIVHRDIKGENVFEARYSSCILLHESTMHENTTLLHNRLIYILVFVSSRLLLVSTMLGSLGQETRELRK
eukprot:COSAG02_NODE_4741_length_5035_cov_2.309562_1_plen_110_part_00